AAPAPKAAPAPAAPKKAAQSAGAGEQSIDAPMPGKIIKLVASVGQSVNAGDVLLILEAMKMQNEITADAAGTVKAFNVDAGNNVAAGDSLVILG
ncbi:MAG: acetyl-CoA carboxylase biotin carboxyl carrier protein subunit, partial [Selenomonadaceae bacterium]|nr:acetyl-CoA carboxylase biotin carboxyl carrier protein subunit [Selenomonadaceae bacterium]